MRITKDTPLVHGEISKKEIKRARKEKYRTGRVMRFKGTKKKIEKKYSKSSKVRRNTKTLKINKIFIIIILRVIIIIL